MADTFFVDPNTREVHRYRRSSVNASMKKHKPGPMGLFQTFNGLSEFIFVDPVIDTGE